MRAQFIILLATVMAVASAHRELNQVAPSILNGKDAPKDRFNYIASLRWPWSTRSAVRKGEFKCTGVLIAPDIVLTTYNCLWPTGLYPEVRLGGYDRNGPGYESKKTVKVVYNKNYTDTYDISYDIALLKLDSVSKYRPVQAPESTPDPAVMYGANLTIAGWGRTEADAENAASNLKMAGLTLQTQEKCKEIWDDYDWFEAAFSTKRAVCGKFVGHNKALCWDDMGAPLLKLGSSAKYDKVVGIGAATKCDNDGSVFTNTARNAYWIQQGIRVINGLPSPNAAKYITRVYPEPLGPS